jgi:hypothetical protein
MTTKEAEFRIWLIDELKKNQGSMGLEETKNSGAYKFDLSQLTIERYVKKWAHSGEIVFVPVGKTMNGHWIHNVVLNKRNN